MTPRDLLSLLEALGLRKPRPRRYWWGQARLPRISPVIAAVLDVHERRVRRTTRRLFPVVVLMVVLRARGRKHQRRGEGRLTWV